MLDGFHQCLVIGEFFLCPQVDVSCFGRLYIFFAWTYSCHDQNCGVCGSLLSQSLQVRKVSAKASTNASSLI